MAIEAIRLKSGAQRFRVVARWGDRTLKSPVFRSLTEAKRCEVKAMDAKALGRSPAEAWTTPSTAQASPRVREWALDVWLPQVVLDGDRPVATATARSYVEAFDVYLAAFRRPACLTAFGDLTFADFEREGPIIVSEMRNWLVRPKPLADQALVEAGSSEQARAAPLRFGRGCKPATASRYMAALSSCLSEAVVRGLLIRNPALAGSRRRGGRQGTQRPVRALTAVQMEQVRRAVLDRGSRDCRRRRRDALLITLLYAEGLRPGEALFLRWRHVGRAALSVEGAVSLGEEKATKTASSRQVDLFTVVRAELADWRAVSPHDSDDDLVVPRLDDALPWEDHDYRNWRRRVWQPAIREVSESNPSWTTLRNATPYFCRHTSATGRLYAQEHPGLVAEQHGHGVGVLHQYYSHVLKDRAGAEGTSWNQQLLDARASTPTALGADIRLCVGDGRSTRQNRDSRRSGGPAKTRPKN